MSPLIGVCAGESIFVLINVYIPLGKKLGLQFVTIAWSLIQAIWDTLRSFLYHGHRPSW